MRFPGVVRLVIDTVPLPCSWLIIAYLLSGAIRTATAWSPGFCVAVVPVQSADNCFGRIASNGPRGVDDNHTLVSRNEERASVGAQRQLRNSHDSDCGGPGWLVCSWKGNLVQQTRRERASIEDTESPIPELSASIHTQACQSDEIPVSLGYVDYSPWCSGHINGGCTDISQYFLRWRGCWQPGSDTAAALRVKIETASHSLIAN